MTRRERSKNVYLFILVLPRVLISAGGDSAIHESQEFVYRILLR